MAGGKGIDPVEWGEMRQTVSDIRGDVSEIKGRLQDGDREFCVLREDVAGVKSSVQFIATTLNTLTAMVGGQAEARGRMQTAMTLAGWLQRTWKPIVIGLISAALFTLASVPVVGWSTGAGVGGLAGILAGLLRVLSGTQGGTSSGP